MATANKTLKPTHSSIGSAGKIDIFCHPVKDAVFLNHCIFRIIPRFNRSQYGHDYLNLNREILAGLPK